MGPVFMALICTLMLAALVGALAMEAIDYITAIIGG